MKKQIKNTNKIQILWLLKRTISNLKKENIIQSAHSIIKILDDHYPFSFNLIVSQMMYLSILRRECDCDLCFTFLKEIELLEETILSINQKILNVFSHFLLKNSSQESKYLLENMIEHNLIESTIIKNKKIPYFVHYMTEKEFFKLYYIDKKSHENQNPFIKKIKENYEELSKNNFELHKKLIKEGHNPNEIAKIIRNDEIEKLQEISSQSNFDFNQTIEPSLYESCDFINNKTVSLIDYAAFFVSVKCFKYLLMNNADVRNTGKYAVAGGNEEIIHLCEQHRSTFVDAYETAIKFQQNDIFKYIYENKIGKIDSLEKLGKKCVLYHNYYIFSFLLKQGMKIDDGIINESARIGNIFLSEYFSEICKMPSDILCFSAASGNIEHVKYLLGKGIYINSEDGFGKSALLHATQNGNIEVVKLLLELKCKVNTQMRVYPYYTALIYASMFGYTEIVKLLLEQEGIDINARDWWRNTALIRASSNGHTEIVKLLLEKEGIDINAQNKYGWTALLIASDNGDTETVKLLLEQEEIDINAKNEYEDTAFEIAYRYCHTEIEKLIIVRKRGEWAKSLFVPLLLDND